MRLSRAAATFLAAALSAHAQLVPPDPQWQEAEVPAPAAVKLAGLIALEIPGTTLRFGVDPASVSVGSDGVVRYVVVASSTSGVVNAMYEGIRCNTGEFKVYARHYPDSGWKPVSTAPWRSLQDQPASRHTLLIARSAACIGRGTNGTATQIVRDLRTPTGRYNEAGR
jgi:hypothetical protein